MQIMGRKARELIYLYINLYQQLFRRLDFHASWNGGGFATQATEVSIKKKKGSDPIHIMFLGMSGLPWQRNNR